MWSIHSAATPPPSVEAVYYLWLPEDNVVLWAYYSNDTDPEEYIGTLHTYKNSLPTGTPMIPMDSHHALCLSWLTMDRMARNRPYLDDAIKAAIALVA